MERYIKTIILIGISSITLFSITTSAFGFVASGYYNAPLQVQVTPSQNWIDQETRNNLISTYGVLLVNSCIAVEPYCQNITSTSGSVSACLRFVQLDLAQGIMKGCSTPCPSGYFKLTPNGQCLTPEVGCNNQFGQNSHFIKYDTAGNPQCGSCEKGYVWDYSNSYCVISQIQQTPPVTGTLCNGKSWNSCPTGQKFYCPSTGDAQCLIDQPVKNNDQILENQCNGKSWGACNAGDKFYCPLSGDPSCIPQKKSSATTTIGTKPEKIIKENILETTLKTSPTIKNELEISREESNTVQSVITTTPAKKGLWTWLKNLFGF